MDITFLIGNGFDIAAGIKTSYKEFYNWYCNQPSISSCVELFKKEIQGDIKNGGKNWSDFEIGLGRYTSKFRQETVEQFIECYEDAHEKIIQYLEEERQKFELAVSKADTAQLFTGILRFYQELSPQEQAIIKLIFKNSESENTQVHFISFNYTNLLEDCINILSREPLERWLYNGCNREFKVDPSIIHIHGTSNKYPILGVSDISKIANQELLSVPHFLEIMVKPVSVNAIGEFWYQNSEKLIKESKIICILGMSLGDSDSFWWRTIMSWLKNEDDRQLIVFWHTEAPLSSRSIYQRQREISKVKKKLADYTDFPKDVLKSLDTRIHVVLNTEKVLKVNLKAKPEVVLV